MVHIQKGQQREEIFMHVLLLQDRLFLELFRHLLWACSQIQKDKGDQEATVMAADLVSPQCLDSRPRSKPSSASAHYSLQNSGSQIVSGRSQGIRRSCEKKCKIIGQTDAFTGKQARKWD